MFGVTTSDDYRPVAWMGRYPLDVTTILVIAHVAAMVVEFKARRDLVVDGLNAIPGIRCLRPTGAFYAFPDISGTGLTGAELAEKLLHEAGVCVLAGTAFGGVGTQHIRISYANSRENLATALERIRGVVEPLAAAATTSGRS